MSTRSAETRSLDRRYAHGLGRAAVFVTAWSLWACAPASSSKPPVHAGANTTAAGPHAAITAAADGGITLRTLLAELTGFEHLTHLPSPAYTTQLTSSFDRASLGAEPGSEAWFANRDWAVPKDSRPLVLLDTDGPGVITRIWSANPSGTLRVYVDGGEAPVIEAPMAALLSGEHAPFVTPFAFVAAGGFNFHFPIAYRSHCRITLESDRARLYFQIEHRRYASGADVEAFSPDVLAASADDITFAAATLRGAASDAAPEIATRATTIRLGRGEHFVQRIAAHPHGSVIRELRLRIDSADAHALRETRLHVVIDGRRTVSVPLGDFFGVVSAMSDVHSLPVHSSLRTQTLVARWPMPFRSEASVELAVTGDTPFAGELSVHSEPRVYTDDTLLFHAYWHAPERRSSEPSSDWHVMWVEGNGYYVGSVLNVENPSASWWGEGDSKLYVDGERFPSHFGTGTEDDYGYAYCSNALFSTPFVGQTRAGEHQNFGGISLYRYRTLDAIPFTKSLRFDLEINHWGSTPLDMHYDALVMFYARPSVQASPIVEDDELFRMPQLTQQPPADVAPGPYTCGAP